MKANAVAAEVIKKKRTGGMHDKTITTQKEILALLKRLTLGI